MTFGIKAKITQVKDQGEMNWLTFIPKSLLFSILHFLHPKLPMKSPNSRHQEICSLATFPKTFASGAEFELMMHLCILGENPWQKLKL